MKKPYETNKEIDHTSEEENEELFSAAEDEAVEITEDDDVILNPVSSRSKRAKKIKRHDDWRRRLDDYFDAKRIRELLDDEIICDIQDPLYRKSSLDRIIADLHQSEE